MSIDPTSELLTAFLTATPERKALALRIMKGEAGAAEPKPVTGPLLLGVCDAARFLGVSRATLWRAIQAGRIEKIELFPGSFRLRRADVEELAAKRPVSSSAKAAEDGHGAEGMEHGPATGTDSSGNTGRRLVRAARA